MYEHGTYKLRNCYNLFVLKRENTSTRNFWAMLSDVSTRLSRLYETQKANHLELVP
jgi:hypothetical protein